MAHLHPFTDPVDAQANPPTVMVQGDGCAVIDDAGNRYIDAASALWCASLGFSNQRLIDAATAQMQQLPYYHNFMGRVAEPTERLAEAIVEKLPDGMNQVFFGCSGSEAVDTAIKLARFHQIGRGRPEKRLILAREEAYHGSGTMSAALSAADYMHDGFDLPMDGVVRLDSTHHRRHAHDGESEVDFSARRAAELEETILRIGADKICAMIGEPVIGSGGAIIPPEGYWEEIQAVLRRHDILLIADEIITGFGRTGEWFACQTYRIQPDLLTMAKQLSGAYFPISGVAVHDHVHEVISAHAHELGTLGHGFTYGGHPVGAAVAMEAIRIYEEMDLPNHVKTLGRQLADRLRPLADHPGVAEIRQVGLLAAIEFEPRGEVGEAAGAVRAEAEANGVIFRPIGDTLAIAPPYVVTPEELDHIVDVMVASIDSTIGAFS